MKLLRETFIPGCLTPSRRQISLVRRAEQAEEGGGGELGHVTLAAMEQLH